MTEAQVKHMVERFLSWKPQKHDYWGAGEEDCPHDIKAGNGELHTLRCKVCGLDDPRDQVCRPDAQAETMVRHMLEALPDGPTAQDETGGDATRRDETLSLETSALLAEAEEYLRVNGFFVTKQANGLIERLAQALREARG